MRKACDGLVLRVSDVGEHDRMLTLLTADEGKRIVSLNGADGQAYAVVEFCA